MDCVICIVYHDNLNCCYTLVRLFVHCKFKAKSMFVIAGFVINNEWVTSGPRKFVMKLGYKLLSSLGRMRSYILKQLQPRVQGTT
jgi:hypothetical protein